MQEVFAHEALMVARLVHPHIVPLVGVVTVMTMLPNFVLHLFLFRSEGQGPPALIALELQPLGQLREHLLRNQDVLRNTQ
jgi:hypothetical protein